MGPWRWLAAAVVWLVTVAVVAAVAWFAIDSAGREVAGARDPMTLVSAVQPSPGLGATATGVAPTPSPSSSMLGAPRPESGTDAGTPSGTSSVPSSGGGWTGTYSSAGGELVVQCVGDRAAGSAQVADGWRVDAGSAGSGLRVLFVAGDGRMAEVSVACRGGQPSFSPSP